MKWLFSYLKKYPGLLILNLIGISGFILTELGLPKFLSYMVDNGILPHHKTVIMQCFIGMILCMVVGISLSILLEWVVAKISTTIVTKIRGDLYRKVTRLSLLETQKVGSASLITRLSNDPVQIFNFLRLLLNAGITAPLMFLLSMILIYQFSPQLSLAVLCALPFLIIGIVLLGKYSGPLSLKMQRYLDQMNSKIQEKLDGLQVIRSLNAQTIFTERFQNENTAYQQKATTLGIVMAIAYPAFNLLFNILLGVILLLGSHLIGSGAIEIGVLMVIIEYIFHALFSMILFCSMFMMYPRAKTSMDRIQEVLHLPEEENQGKEFQEKVTKIEVQDVGFAFPDQPEVPVLQNVSFTVEKGQKLALMGRVGSGKSTLLKELALLYPFTTGSYLWNGQSLEEYALSSLRKKVVYVPQESYLFSGTVKENLQDGNENATEEEMWHALSIAQADQFIQEKGLEGRVEEGGSNFSGGQRQRLAIARALLRKGDLYLFDDSFSALDATTEHQLQKALQEELSEAICVLASHRRSTIEQADQVILFVDGKMKEVGTPQELAQHSALYRSFISNKEEEIIDENMEVH